MKPNQSRFDRVVTSLLTGIAGAGFGMLPWMMDAGSWWVVGCGGPISELVLYGEVIGSGNCVSERSRRGMHWTTH